MKIAEKASVLLVCSSGGHLLQMLALRDAWDGFSHLWVTEGTRDALSLLASERMIEAHWPAERSFRNLLRNALLAWKVCSAANPDVLVSTGAAVAVPFVWVAWIRGIRVIHIESLTRIVRPSLSGRLIAPASDHVYVQWPELTHAFRRSRYVGSVFGVR